jgi:hypothetical protein
MKSSIALVVLSLSIAASSGFAAELPDQQYQDWYGGSDKANTFTSAITLNADHDGLGEFCYRSDKHCEWRFGTKTECKKDGSKQMVMINGSATYNVVQVTCLGFSKGIDLYMYAILDWKSLEEILRDRDNDKIAFAIPLSGSMFRVLRFSTRGALEATAYAGGPITGEQHSVEEARNMDATL